ncbi:hypothetical protein BJ508DRAFT_336974 [Ascobolus immersus RN42]|uniref:Uncharacterized protein n=1 Tax=Ascobolus immersus RN42 TaxID=1160509 RepID=A0A3N4H6Q4_ASCIM|nr:hypothetical protein BJ508DRAFT_336974 [Ascobolus immersus RN42]
MSEDPRIGYHPERMPLLVDHPDLTDEQRRAWGDHGPDRRGVNHPAEDGPKPAGSYGEFFGKMSTAQMSCREQFHQQLDIDYEHQRSIKLGIMNAKREVTRYSLLEAKRRQFDQMLEDVRREIEENARALRERIRQEEETGERTMAQLKARRQEVQSLELQHRERLAEYDEEARRINTRLDELQSDLVNSQEDLAEVIELCKISDSTTMTKEQLQNRKEDAISEYKEAIEEMAVGYEEELTRLRREHETARKLLIASQRDKCTALKSSMEQEMSLIRTRGNDALETVRKQVGRRLGRERQAAWDEIVALSNKGPEYRQKVFNQFFSGLSVAQRSSLLSEWLVSGTTEAQNLQDVLADPTSVEYTTLASNLFAQFEADTTPAPHRSTSASAPLRIVRSLLSRFTRQKPQEEVRGTTDDEPKRALNRALLRKKWADEELQRHLAEQQVRDAEEQRRLDEEKKASIERGLLKLERTLGGQSSVVEAHQTHYNPGGSRFRKRGHSVGADWDISNGSLITKRRRVGPGSDVDPSEITFTGRE